MATLIIDGMTCAHCVRAVTQAVHTVSPRSTVRIDLPTGTATITGTGELVRTEIIAAIEAEGYAVKSFAPT